MSERSFVEKPFLDQLAALGWHIVDQGGARRSSARPADQLS